MPSRPILESHPVYVLRKEISKTNIKGYSKMKKAEVITLMLKRENASKFSHIKMNEKSKPKEITIVPKRKIKAERAKKISAPKREAQKATVIPPKKRVASVPKVVKAEPKKKQTDLTPREVYMRGDFTEKYKKELRNAEERKKGIPSQSWRGDDWVDKEYKAIKERLSKTIEFTNTPLFKVGQSVDVNISPSSTRKQAAKIVGLGKTITIKFDKNDSNSVSEKERGGTKRFIKYSNVVARDDEIRRGQHETESILQRFGGSQIDA